MAWRLARSLEVLRDEVRTLHPGTTVWTLGNPEHQEDDSDHNPNEDEVVCASDTLGNAGLDLGWYAERVRQAGIAGHPAPKYVIYNRRIASRSRGWTWRAYGGSNPHTGHVHTSVGVGPDGASTGPYDDTSPWGLIGEEDMQLTKDDVMTIFRTDGVLRAPGDPEEGNRFWTAETYLQSARWHAKQARDEAVKVRGMVASLAGQDVEAEVRTAIREEFAALTDAAVAAVREAVPDANQDTAEAALRAVLGSLDEPA